MRVHWKEERLVARIDREREVNNRLARKPKGGAGLTAPRMVGPREAWERLWRKDDEPAWEGQTSLLDGKKY